MASRPLFAFRFSLFTIPFLLLHQILTMKEEYLHSSTLEKSVEEMVAELTGRHYRPKPWKLIPGKAALLVLDMQNYFLDPASHAFTPSAPAIVPNIRKLILMAQKHKMEIIFTRHVNDEANAGMMGHWWRDMIRKDSFEGEISRTVRRYDGKMGGGEEGKWGGGEAGKWGGGEEGKWGSGDGDETVGLYDCKIIMKNQYDAFYRTDLEDYLRSKSVEQVIICGLLANLCCETTARSAFVRGFEVLFPVDATAAYNRDFHMGTFRNLGFGFCPIIKTSELTSSIDED
jgi:isochorismate hydrolase